MSSSADMRCSGRPQQMRYCAVLHRLLYRLNASKKSCNILLERTSSKSNCAFYVVEDNCDEHNFRRCSKYRDQVARPLQTTKLGLCYLK
ncbi:hypothetical protein RB195_024969 [Necator americanus]|uniref:Uncharacterized protein n=1 Tax=Necator americanus TaxID=51031 RepID=A0ABR1EQC4_NECAM